MKLAFGNVEFFPPHWNFDFMARRKFFVGISVAMVLASLLVIMIKGVNYSIDFLGGAELTLQFKDQSLNRDELVKAAEAANVGNVEVTTVGKIGIKKEGEFLLRIQHDKNLDKDGTSTRVDTLKSQLVKTFGADKFEVKSINNISGKIGKEEEIKGYLALLLACLGILAYISLRFDSRFAPGAVLCLVHDVIIALGFMTALGKPFSTSSIAAFLTIVGYSINDTVIIYDRIRERQTLFPKMGILEVINSSISQTMNRTILTSSTGLMGLLVLILLGGGALEDFALTMFIGILVGTYSSIYVAAPLTIMMEDLLKKAGWTPKDRSQKAKVLRDPNYSPPVLIKKKP